MREEQIHNERVAAKKRRGINREAMYVIVSSLLILFIPYFVVWTFDLSRHVGFVALGYAFVAAPSIIYLPFHTYSTAHEGWYLSLFYWAVLMGLVASSLYCAWRLGARYKIPNVLELTFLMAFWGVFIVCVLFMATSLASVIFDLLAGQSLHKLGNAIFMVPFILVIGFVLSLPLAFVCSGLYLWLVRPILLKRNLVSAPYHIVKPYYDFDAGGGRASLWPR